ncbi:MAG TPA: universal stress protein [Polyangiaceae bacterium]
MFRNILVPTDFGPASENAQKLAAELARKFGSALTLMHVYEVPSSPYPDAPFPVECIAPIERAAAVGLDRALSSLRKRSAGATSVLREGVPWEEIRRVATDVGADLIVMGTHGRGGIRHGLHGSVAERVVRTARIPVLTVHAAESAAVDGDRRTTQRSTAS